MSSHSTVSRLVGERIIEDAHLLRLSLSAFTEAPPHLKNWRNTFFLLLFCTLIWPYHYLCIVINLLSLAEAHKITAGENQTQAICLMRVPCYPLPYARLENLCSDLIGYPHRL